MSVTVRVRLISWSWLRRSNSFCSSGSEVVSRILRSSSKEQRSLMPHSLTSKEKKGWASTQPLVMILTGLPSTVMVTRLTPAASACSALARVIFSPASISSSPVSGVDHVLGRHLAGDAAGQGQLLVHLVPANRGRTDRTGGGSKKSILIWLVADSTVGGSPGRSLR